MTAIAMIAWAITMSVGVAAATPQWLVGIAATAGIDPEVALRVFTGLLVSIAAAIILLGRRGAPVARFVAAAMIFNAIAQSTHLWRRGTGDTTGWWLVASTAVAGILILACSSRCPKRSASTRSARPGLTVVGIMLALVAGAAVAANLRIAVPPSMLEDGSRSSTREVEDFPIEAWVGLPLAETGLLEHLPQIRPLADVQPTMVVFYRPECGSCHEFFDEKLGDPPPVQTIAVRVPPGDGVTVAETDLPEDILCDDCIRLTLPRGPIWIVEAPSVILIQDGTVTCVSSDDVERCLDLAHAITDG